MQKKYSHYIRFTLNGILFFSICLFLDLSIGKILKHYYFTSKTGVNFETRYSMDSTKAAIIILGSSRASHHYIPQLIQDSIGMTCYNTGRDGNYLFYSYSIFKSIINRYKPKIIILDINPDEFNFNQKYYDGLSTLLPFYKTKPELQRIINLKSSFERIKLQSSIYPFNSTLLELFKANLNANSEAIKALEGYIPLYGSSIDKSKISKVENKGVSAKIDTNKIIVLTDLVKECNKLGVRLLVFNSPRYSNAINVKAEKYIADIIKSNHADFINYGNDNYFLNNPNLFKDAAHLNNEGAIIFTNLVIDRILNR